LIDDLESARIMGQAARVRMAEFGPEREYQAWHRVYTDLLGQRTGSAVE
jgi:hypothetical protein